ncbi:hypothetical protein [Pusillimonas minor]|uniref:hypothetical protein n=1 Tax=Pusillimonas minor TaxID=2697024 RepID=UPI002017035A|nr:hypothetical protein [Pusillimonas minor]
MATRKELINAAGGHDALGMPRPVENKNGIGQFEANLDQIIANAKGAPVAMTRIDTIWDQLFPAEQTRIFKLLIEKVIVSPTDLEVRLRPNGIERLVLELRPEPAKEAAEVTT